MTTTVEPQTRETAIEQANAEWSRLTELHERAVAELHAEDLKVIEAERQYGDLLVQPDATPSALTKAWKQVETANRQREIAGVRVRAINEKGVAAEEERSRLITARMREEQETQRREIYAEADRLNLGFIQKLRAAYALLAPGSSVDVIFGGRDLLEYVGSFQALQERAKPLGVTVYPYSLGVVRLAWQKGLLEPSHPGPYDPLAL